MKVEIGYELTLQGEKNMTQQDYYSQLLAMRGNTREATTAEFDAAVTQLHNFLANEVYAKDIPQHIYIGGGSEVTRFVGLKILNNYTNPSVTVHMPCGERLVIPMIIPAGDVPCPCGNPNHMMVQYVNTFEEEVTR